MPTSSYCPGAMGAPHSGEEVRIRASGASCPMSPITVNLPPFVFNSCNGTMAAAVGNLVPPPLNSSLIAMLSRYPAPLTYDAAGLASPGKRVTQTDKYQWRQVTTFYGNIQ